MSRSSTLRRVARSLATLSCASLLTATAVAQDEQTISEDDLESELAQFENDSFRRGVTISGFMDFGATYAVETEGLLKFLDSNTSFAVGNANVYFNAEITRHLRSLLEVRFTYLPNGANPGGGSIRTAVPDYTNGGRGNDVGSIMIERAYGEYEFDSRLKVRFGQWLTPYGIWNVDHGTPTIIPINIPYAIGQGLIPRQQTGVEVLGALDVTEYSQIGYHLTLSNGRGPFSTHYDLDDNKAIGGRLRFGYQRVGDLSIGASWYYGRSTDAQHAPSQPGGEVPSEILSQFDELALAADIKWEWEGLHLQAELVHQQARYAEGGRKDLYFGKPLAPDHARWGAYGLMGQRIPKIELMPYLKLERLIAEPVHLTTATAGLNYRPLPELVLKVEANKVYEDIDGFKADATLVSSQVAWAF